MPSEELFINNNLIFNNQMKRNNTFSIKSQNILLPTEGLFVSFEFLSLNDDINFFKLCPRIVGNCYADKDYMWFNSKEKGWVLSEHKLDINSKSSGNRKSYNLTVKYKPKNIPLRDIYYCVPNVAVVVAKYL